MSWDLTIPVKNRMVILATAFCNDWFLQKIGLLSGSTKQGATQTNSLQNDRSQCTRVKFGKKYIVSKFMFLQ